MGRYMYRLPIKDTTVPKIAICFAGLPRIKSETEITWRKFIERYDADVFVHTWLLDGISRDQVNKQIVNSLAPTLLLTEQSRKFNTSLYSERIWPHRSEPTNVLSMWYSIKESINLCLTYSNETNIKYDIICRARFDWLCDNLELQQNDNAITVPNDVGLSGHRFKYKGRAYTAHNDQFGYGNPEYMALYADTFNQIPFLYANEYMGFCSELFLTSNLLSHNILIEYQKGLNYRILK